MVDMRDGARAYLLALGVLIPGMQVEFTAMVDGSLNLLERHRGNGVVDILVVRLQAKALYDGIAEVPRIFGPRNVTLDPAFEKGIGVKGTRSDRRRTWCLYHHQGGLCSVEFRHWASRLCPAFAAALSPKPTRKASGQ